jgi:DNA-binding GntR family transcriptional regulator
MPKIEEVLPKYLQIANNLRDRILGGELQPGDEVPSERQLSADWGVSRPTATRALETMRVWGLVQARQGSGTYVMDQGPLNRRARERYVKSRQTGRIYGPGERAEIVAAEWAEAPEYVRDALNLPAGSQAVRRKRVIYSADAPVEVSQSWFAPTVAEDAPRLLDVARIKPGTIAYVESATGRSVQYARDKIAARLASPDERASLNLEQPAAVMVVRHVVYDTRDEPLEFAESVYPQGRWAFEEEYILRG